MVEWVFGRALIYEVLFILCMDIDIRDATVEDVEELMESDELEVHWMDSGEEECGYVLYLRDVPEGEVIGNFFNETIVLLESKLVYSRLKEKYDDWGGEWGEEVEFTSLQGRRQTDDEDEELPESRDDANLPVPDEDSDDAEDLPVRDDS